MTETTAGFQKQLKYVLIPLVFVGLVGLWAAVVKAWGISSFVLPSPSAVWDSLMTLAREGTLWPHALVTIQEAGLGFASGFVFATVVGYALGKSELLEQVVSPYLVAIQSVLIIGIAPLLIIWLGFGIASKVAICFIVVFFPMLVSTVVGIRTVSADHRALMRSYSASRWMVFRHLELESSLPLLLAGFKTSIVRAMMGAMVGEYIGGKHGLGYLLIAGGAEFLDTSMVLAATVALVGITILLYLLALALETALIPAWRRSMAKD